MIRYFVNEKKKQVIGLLEGTQWDAINKINKIIRDTDFCFCPGEKFVMPDKFRAIVNCDPRDEFSVEEGKKKAKERIMRRYYNALDKRIDKLYDAALVLNGKVFNTPKEFENTP